MTQVARSRFLPRSGDHAPWVLRVVEFNRKGMEVNVSVRTIIRAQPATNAPIFNNHFQRVPPPDRPYGAANHTQRIAALSARRSNKIFIEP